MTTQAQADQEAERMRKMVEERRHQRGAKEAEVSGLGPRKQGVTSALGSR